MIKDSTDLHAPTSVLFWESYTNQDSLVENIKPITHKIQCIVSNFEINGIKTIALGNTQKPSIFDFADNINTLDFLKTI